MHTESHRTADARTPLALSPAVAGSVAGLVAGAAYLAAQSSAAAVVLGGRATEPLQRMAAILMGPDIAPPPAVLDVNVAGMGLLIHFALALVFGRLVERVVRGLPPRQAMFAGGVVGLALYFFNFWLVAPSAFPWFEASRHVVTAADHWLFGACAGFVAAHLRAR